MFKAMAGTAAMKTGKTTEGSFMMSLGELSRMEVERQQAEIEAARLQREALLRGAEEAAAREAAEALRVEREVEAAREAARVREAERAARAAAEATALVAGARLAEELRARASEADKQRTHELLLERARLDAGTRGVKRSWLGAIAGAAIVAIAAAALNVGVIAPRQNAELALARADATHAEESATSAQQQVDQATHRAQTAEDDARAAHAQAEKLAGQLADAQKSGTNRLPSWQGGPARTGVPGQTTTTQTGPDNSRDNTAVCSGPDDPDPMCQHRGAGH
jgi:hypothetical protein